MFIVSAEPAESMSQLLVSFLKKEAGNSLRAIIRYNHTELTVEYSRDDLTKRTVERRAHAVFEQVVLPSDTQGDELIEELGRKRATLQVREKTVIVHLLESRYRGHLISLEPDAARDLTTFLDRCLQYVE